MNAKTVLNQELTPKRAIVKFKLIGSQGGGTLIGDDTDTIETLTEVLNMKYGDRLATVENNS